MMARTKRASAQVVPVEIESSRISGGWLLVHGLPLITPLIGCVVFAGLIELAHAGWGGDPIWTPLLSILLLLIGGLITLFGWISAGPRVLLRTLMTVTGTLATGTLVLGLIVGMALIWPAYLLCSLVVTTLWAIWRGTKYAGAVPAPGEGGNPLLDAIRQAKVQFNSPTIDERGVVRASVSTLPGGTLDGARALMPLVSAAGRVVPGGTNLAPDLDQDGVAEVEIATRDNLKAGVPWPGVSGIGTLPTEPFAIAEYQTGPCQVQIVGDVSLDRRAPDIKHLKIGGVTGSGKSTGAQVFLASKLVKRRLNIVGVDLSKGLQTFGPLVHGMTWVITNDTEARLFLQRLKHVIKGRTNQLASEKLMRWSPASRLNLLVIWVEESKEFRKFATLYADLVADARSAGIMFVSSTQRWIYRSVSTDVRANHGSAIMFGVEEYDDAEAILPKEALAAIGKSLQLWGSSRPGYCYVTGLGIPSNRWGSMARVYDPRPEQLVRAVELGAPYRDPMDPVTAELFGELFARRTIYTGPVWGSDGPQDAPAAPAPPAHAPRRSPAPEPAGDGYRHPQAAAPTTSAAAGRYHREAAPAGEEEMTEMAEAETAQDREAMRVALDAARREHLGEDARAGDFDDVDPNTPISGDIVDSGDGDAEDGESKPSPEEAQRIWDTALDGWYREGRTVVRTADLTELLTTVRRSRRFLYRQTGRWQEMGCIAARPDADGWDLIASPMETAGRR